MLVCKMYWCKIACGILIFLVNEPTCIPNLTAGVYMVIVACVQKLASTTSSLPSPPIRQLELQ